MKREYPFKAWVLTPSFNPAEVHFVSQSWSPEWSRTESGKRVHCKDHWDTKAEAIAVGRQRIADKEAALKKSLEKLDKHRSTLDKAESEQ